MSTLQTLISSILLFCSIIAGATETIPIRGELATDVEKMYQYVRQHNPTFNREIAQAFHTVGERYGIRGDIALCQAIIETGWFRFDNGTAVLPEAHNYCGLGVQQRGETGCSFNSIEEGVTAMIQHLYAYSCTDDVPQGETIIDPRFGYVRRGCAPAWEDLAGKWAMNPHYAVNILKLYDSMTEHKVETKQVMVIEVTIPDEEFISDEEIVHDATTENNEPKNETL